MLNVSGTVKDIRQPRVDAIAAISLLTHERPGDLYAQVTAERIRIRDRSLIGEIAEALRAARPWHATHAYEERICWLAVEYDHATRYCQVTWVRDQGVVFQVCLRYRAYPGLGNSLGTYRNDDLGPIVLRAAAARPEGPVPQEGE